MMQGDDALVADYIGRLRSAASTLPTDRRDELVEDITAHIEEARAAGTAGGGPPAHMRNVLERLGRPEDIVRAIPGWLGITLGGLVLLLAIAAPILVAIRLLRHVGDADPAPGPQTSWPVASS